MNSEQKQRLKKLSKTISIYLLIGIAYLVFTKLTGLGIPCIVNMTTGIHCPGCGVSRMFMALASLDIVGAFNSNALILCLLPFGITLFITKCYQHIKHGQCNDNALMKAFYIIAFVLCIIFTIMRNTEAYSFLAPH